MRDDVDGTRAPIWLLSRLAPHALGVALGIVTAALQAAATAVLLVRDGTEAGPHLGLLGQFLPGYTVSWSGVVIGAGYAFVAAYGFGAAFAIVRNVAVALYLRFVWSRLQHHVASDLLDRIS